MKLFALQGLNVTKLVSKYRLCVPSTIIIENVRFISDEPTLSVLTEEIKLCCEGVPPVPSFHPKVGDICCAQFSGDIQIIFLLCDYVQFVLYITLELCVY